MSLFLGTDRPLSARAAGSPHRTICSPWRARACAPSSGRRSSGPVRRMRELSSPGGRTTSSGKPVSFVRRAAGSERRRGASVDLLYRRAEAASRSEVAAVPRGIRSRGRRTRTGTRSDAERNFEDAIRNLEISSEEQKAINEEALSVNEEFQSTNEELLTSKEELQSLNEELTALNSQLQETLERQRTTSERSAECPLQHRCRDAFPGHQAQYPLLHAGHEVALQHHPRRYRAAARRPQLAVRPTALF